MRAFVLALCLGSVSAFAPVQHQAHSSALNSKNGWTVDEKAFCFGLPGALAPVGPFDPLGLSNDLKLDELKRYREAETQHGRVAMLAAVGILVGENYHPLFGLEGKEILAIDSLTEVRLVFPQFFEILTVAIGALELNRAIVGWKNPATDGDDKVYTQGFLREGYYPGDVGFDPLGLKPKTDEEWTAIATKEIQNGRLAMLGVAGMVAQELVDRKPILFNDFGAGTLLDQSNPLY